METNNQTNKTPEQIADAMKNGGDVQVGEVRQELKKEEANGNKGPVIDELAREEQETGVPVKDMLDTISEIEDSATDGPGKISDPDDDDSEEEIL